jgi:L-asparaginase
MTTTPASLGDDVQHRSVSQGPEITVLATGGTIDKIYNVAGELEIGPPAAAAILAGLTTDLRVAVESVLAKDSRDITDIDRGVLVQRLDELDTARVVITHGTDTLADTAEYVHRHRRAASGKVVVLTGALQPAAMIRSDAALNIGAALASCQTLGPGTYVCMSGRIFPAGTVRKDFTTGRFVGL